MPRYRGHGSCSESVRPLEFERREDESSQTRSTLEDLRLAIHGVTAPVFCEGTFVPDKPVTFVFQDRTRFEVPCEDAFEQKNELKPLLEHCKPAPFGEGKKTRYDRKSARRASTQGRREEDSAVENFDPESAGILNRRSSENSCPTTRIPSRRSSTLSTSIPKAGTSRHTRTRRAAATCLARWSCVCRRNSGTASWY